MFAIYGFRPLSEKLLAVEEAAGLADASGAGAALAGLDAEVERAVGHLNDWRQKQQPAA